MLLVSCISPKYSLVAQQTKSILISFKRMRSFGFSLGEIKRPLYAQLYPTVLVKPDGSTIRIKYHEPIELINLPLDLAKLDESVRKKLLLKRQSVFKKDSNRQSENEKIIEKDIKFDPKKYLNMKKK